jgi:predicted O-linked N-acetylglucosamine transferase (SPINDLY family)
VAQLTAPLFELHDRSRFEVIGVSCGVDDGSALRRRVAAAFDRFLDVHGEDDASAAARIAAHGVHLLVDLSGHTRDARPGILARRPAPVLVSYLGYPGSLGGLADYILADHFVVPAAAEEHYAERVIHLPDSYFIHDGGRNLDAPAPTRVQCGLPPRGFVYCCFNRPFKITPDVFAVWMRLLERVPSSVLWLAEGSAVAAANLRQEARSRGVDPSRLVFAPRVAGLGDHLARHRVADLFLDTLPYNAHTTACDALAAGLPVLTCAGRSFASRVGASLLHAAGLPELVTSSLEAYESLALELAQEPVRLLELRERLARHRWQAPLFDTDRRRRQLEAAYTEMWRKWEAGEAPQGFALGAEAGG